MCGEKDRGVWGKSAFCGEKVKSAGKKNVSCDRPGLVPGVAAVLEAVGPIK